MVFIGSFLWAVPTNTSEKNKFAAIIALSSIVLLTAIGYDGHYDSPSIVFGMATAVLSVVLAAALGFVKDLAAGADRGISGVLALLWVSSAIFMAWDHHGNALFSTFVGTLFTVKNFTRSVYKSGE